VLVGCAQSRIDQASLENEIEIGIMRAVEDQSAPIPGERTSKLGRVNEMELVVRCAQKGQLQLRPELYQSI